MFCTDKSSWNVTTLSLLTLLVGPSQTLPVSPRGLTRGVPHARLICSRMGSMSAPDSICSNKLAARSGSMFLKKWNNFKTLMSQNDTENWQTFEILTQNLGDKLISLRSHPTTLRGLQTENKMLNKNCCCDLILFQFSKIIDLVTQMHLN